ncbi:hypothetical protein [Pontiella agarivorans]|uniref:Tetratricopeptide repeat protein n=1 Tax=Pontiella agarivorans TaxID=3038953 RepID=A0ABU5MT43_9BACT|nr:hypothetical protein [Pontiella agarivorans]MDZ8117380.1 hypothetical protein [Pontiella agarivorans]
MAEVKLENAPDDILPYYEKGLQALKRNNYAYAMDMFETVLALEPRLLQVRRKLRTAAVTLAKQNPPGRRAAAKNLALYAKAARRLKKQPELTVELSEKLLKSDPLNPKYAKLQADAAEAADLPEIAILTLEIINENRPAEAALLSRLAGLYQQTNQIDLEFECREKIAQLIPGDAQAAKALKDAAARLTMGKTGRRKAEMSSPPVPETENELMQEPADPALKMAYADQMIRERKYDSAIRILEEFSTLHPEHTAAEKKLQTARERQLAIRLAAAEDDQNEAEAVLLRQELAHLKIQSARRETERYPNDLQLKFELGKLCYKAGQLTEAIQQFQSAQHNPHRRIRALIYLGKAFYEKGQADIASEQFEKALAELPDMNETRKEVLYELGVLRMQTGEPEKGTALLKEIYTFDIGYRDVAERIENPA